MVTSWRCCGESTTGMECAVYLTWKSMDIVEYHER
jgi:hypothetical protein